MLNRAPLSRKLMLILVAALIGMTAIGWLGLQTLDRNLLADRQAETRYLISTAVDAVETLHQQAESGALAEETAQALALEVLRGMDYGDGDYFFVVDQGGIMLAHGVNADLEGRDVSGLEDVNGVRLIEGLIAGARDGGGFVPYVWPREANGEPIDKLSYAEIFEPWGWVIATGIYIDDVDAVFWEELVTSLVVGLAIAAIMGAAVFAIARSVTGPIHRLSGAMNALAGGDHSIEIPARGWKNEIGTMADAVQVFKEQAIENTRLAAEQKAAEARTEQQKREMMMRLADDFEGSVGGIVHAVTDAATEMQSTSHSMTGISEEANRQSATVASAAQQAAANVQTVASAAEELGSSIAEISRQVQTQRDVACVASEAAGTTNADMTTLAGRAEKIGAVIGLITGIAEQTNLLALNATIEAARAGEAGKGFAVVASEVKNLANQTAKATEEIGEQIRAMQEQTGRTVASIGTITAKIEELNEICAAVAAAVEQQNSATHEIARNANEAASGTHQVTEAIEGVSRAASETGTASGEVLQAAESLSRDAARLSEEVQSFLQNIRAA